MVALTRHKMNRGPAVCPPGRCDIRSRFQQHSQDRYSSAQGRPMECGEILAIAVAQVLAGSIEDLPDKDRIVEPRRPQEILIVSLGARHFCRGQEAED